MAGNSTGPEEVQMLQRHHQDSNNQRNPDDRSHDCGWWTWRPRLLNSCNNSRWLLLCLGGLVFSTGISINGFTNLAITSLKRRFELSSSQTALIPVIYEIFSSVFIIITGYFFAQGNKPKFIASGGVFVGLGCIVFILPHFLTGTYTYNKGGTSTNTTNLRLCPNVENVTSCGEDESSTVAGGSISALSKYLYVFLLGQVLLGVGNAPSNALRTILLDDSVKAKYIGLYLGIDSAVAHLATSVGFIVGGILLEALYTDYMQVDAKGLGLSPSDSQWVGAWWLGFIVCAVGAFLFSILISCFPSRMSGTEAYYEERKGQEQDVPGLDKASQPGFGITFRDIPAATLVLFRNPLYVFLVLSNISDISYLSGAEVFLPKFIELQFGLSAGDAAITFGVIVTVSGSSLLLGGWFIKIFDLTVSGMLKLCLGSNIVCALVLAGIFFRCAEVPFAGINVPYSSGNEMSDALLDMDMIEAPCNFNCNCSVSSFSPICSTQGVTYFSACHAGCQNYDQEMNQYHNCSCVTATDHALNIPANDTATTAVPGTCSETCVQFYIFCLFLSVVVFTYLLTGIPRATVNLRCVPQTLRAYSSAMNSLIVRLLGSLPGALIFGYLLDNSCLLWNEECGVRGRCYHYDRNQVAYSVFLYGFIMKLIAIACFIGTLVTYKPQREADKKT